MTNYYIYQNINIMKWELILWASFIEILEIYTNSYLAISLLYRNYVS